MFWFAIFLKILKTIYVYLIFLKAILKARNPHVVIAPKPAKHDMVM